MTITIDCMFSVDLMVDETKKTAMTLVDRLGLPPMRDTWTDRGLEHIVYLRAFHPFGPAAPTLIEVITASPSLPAVQAQARDRPLKSHATVFVTKTFREVVANVAEQGLRHFEMPDPGDGLSRLFMGVDGFSPGTRENVYDTGVDGHLFIEVISWEGTTLATRDALPHEVPEGGITRVVAGSHLVPDIDETMRSLARIFHWAAADEVPSDTGDVRHATLQPLMPTSAALELIQPTTSGGRYGEYFARWGAGPHAMRLGVRGLEAKARDLDRRGTGFRETETLAGEPALLVDEIELDGVIVEFVEDPLSG
jgi:hypothetical protein